MYVAIATWGVITRLVINKLGLQRPFAWHEKTSRTLSENCAESMIKNCGLIYLELILGQITIKKFNALDDQCAYIWLKHFLAVIGTNQIPILRALVIKLLLYSSSTNNENSKRSTVGRHLLWKMWVVNCIIQVCIASFAPLVIISQMQTTRTQWG